MLKHFSCLVGILVCHTVIVWTKMSLGFGKCKMCATELSFGLVLSLHMCTKTNGFIKVKQNV